MNDIAKGCPFCGGNAELETTPQWPGATASDAEGTAYALRCLSCAALGPWRKTQTGAYSAWNGRVTLPETP
jgi:Lar family restriction alleviation protein